jgi:antitoxin component of MazEF toxin-antitoxin module
MEQGIKKWIVEVRTDPWGHPCIEIPDQILDMLNLKEGDTVIWIDNKDGSFTFKKKEEEDDSI